VFLGSHRYDLRGPKKRVKVGGGPNRGLLDWASLSAGELIALNNFTSSKAGSRSTGKIGGWKEASCLKKKNRKGTPDVFPEFGYTADD